MKAARTLTGVQGGIEPGNYHGRRLEHFCDRFHAHGSAARGGEQARRVQGPLSHSDRFRSPVKIVLRVVLRLMNSGFLSMFIRFWTMLRIIILLLEVVNPSWLGYKGSGILGR